MLKIVADYIKIHIIKSLLIFLILTIAVPCVINLAYFVGEGKNANTFFKASDLLIYWGSLLGFSGTIFLGVLALLQNERLNKVNTMLTRLHLEGMIPSLIVDSFVETERASSRLPDTTKSVLTGSVGKASFASAEAFSRYENEQNEIIAKIMQIQNNALTTGSMQELNKLQTQLFDLGKTAQINVVETFSEIFWMINKNSVESLTAFPPTDNYATVSYKVCFKNSSDSRITKIRIDRLTLDCGYSFQFIPLETHNCIDLMLNKDDIWIFYINMLWNNSDNDLTQTIKMQQLRFNIALSLSTIGGIEQSEFISITSWLNNVSYSYTIPPVE